ncbi:alpha-(1,6)-fucosyltransferase-like [Centruroides vittatus]|uniref:alpha-(1,6)-fucosyltransferase-like n=1 Tax=Centruroides vittatus TaxID=120091 RepID=UPI0035101DCA
MEGWSSNRKLKAFRLGEIVQNRIDKLQNPDQCHISKVLLCNLTNPHGLASSIHDVLWCFIKAYYSGMMMVLDISHWHYEIKSWESAFLSLSRTCQNMNISHISNSPWPGKNDDEARSDLGRLPLDLKLQLIHLFDQPLVWWYGQFIRYLLRPNAAFESYLKTKKKLIGFSSPIVGIHVRRTDKIDNEAKFHDLHEYMYHVEDYYKRQELDNPRLERKVFIATDDPNVITECNSNVFLNPRYQRFTCLSFSENADLAYNMKSRYTNSSAWGSLIDIFLLANCDFLICTFSSGFCRLAYELMHSIQPDASNRVHSLDVEYLYAWKKPPQRLALYSHVPKSPKELWFHRGSLISKQDEFSVMYSALSGKIWNGLLDGFIVKTGEKGSYPIFKTIEHYNVDS